MNPPPTRVTDCTTLARTLPAPAPGRVEPIVRLPFIALTALLFTSAAGPAHAATTSEACSGVRIDADASCEHRLELGCGSTCDPRDMLFACAAELAASCRASCDLDVDITCTGDCDALCEDRCRVEDVKCDSECADECADLCVDQCADADDPAQCRAGCEATCDVECADACAGVPIDADCQTHCEECCTGACSASANFDCQLGCQADAWQACEQALLTDCEASCGLDGSVYCDGQYVAGGEETLECVDDLEDAGLAVETEFDVGGGFCSVGSRGGAPLSLLVLGLLGLRRRRTSAAER